MVIAQYNLTVVPGLFSIPPTGLVTGQPGNNSCSLEGGCPWPYPAGTVVTLFAWNTAGTSFQGWTYNQSTFVSTSPVYTLPPLNSSQTIHADYVYSTGPYTLTVYKGATGNGSVSGTAGFSCPVDSLSQSQGNYSSNAPVILTNQPAAGWSFAYWNYDGVNYTSPTFQLNMTGDSLVQAVFVQNPNPPIVNLISPAANITNWVCQQFYIAATATAQSGVITNLEFFLGSTNGTLLDARDGNAQSVTASIRWTTTVPGSTNTFVVRATDNNGQQAVSSPVRITTVMPPFNQLVIGITNMQCALCLSNLVGRTYNLLAVTNLATPMMLWSNLGKMQGTNGYSSFLDPAFTNLPDRFYRASSTN